MAWPSAFLLLLCGAAVAMYPCNNYTTCDQCVAAPFCGWCSTPVQYKDGAKGYQCAGFGSGSEPFVCNGIYSTEKCVQGYVCNTTTYQCQLTAPGAGMPLADCQANCSTVGKTFLCDNATHTCKVAPAGKGTSLEVCEAQCAAPTPSPTPSPTHHTASPSPGPHPPPPSSTPATTLAPTYSCNATTLKCDPAKPGHGTSLAVCDAACKQRNVTPPALLGLWRSFPISVDNPVVEYDLDFTSSQVRLHTPEFDTVCDVVSIGTDHIDLVNCKAPEPPMIKCIYQIDPSMPETYQMVMACNHGTGDAPANFADAMANGKIYTVVFMSKCVQDGVCKFTFGPSAQARMAPSHVKLGARSRLGTTLGYSDPCTTYGANCTYCLSHQYCGWCSAKVIYSDGTEGNNCAGFNPDPAKKNPFTCSGTYSTEMCLPGWVCVPENQTCVPTTPGSGNPSKADCLTGCRAQPGPPSVLLGTWRGLMINNEYPYGVFTVTLNETTIVVTLEGSHIFSGVLTHNGDTLFIKLSDGPNKGATIIGMFVSQQDELVQYITITFGGYNAPEPSSYQQGMRPPNIELVLTKCIISTCHF